MLKILQERETHIAAINMLATRGDWTIGHDKEIKEDLVIS